MKPFDQTKPYHVFSLWILIMTLWVVLSYSGTSHIIPTITDTFNGLVKMWNEGLMTHLISSFSLFGMSLVIAVIVSTIISYGILIPTFKPLVVVISKLRFLPLTGITFYLSMVITSARTLQVWLLVIFMSTYLITSLVSVFTSTTTDEINHAKTLGLSRWEILYHVIIVGKIDYVLESVRQNFSIIWLMLVTVESLLATTGGIGFLIKNQDKFMNLGSVLALQIIILLIGISLDYGLTKIRKSIFRYSVY